MADLAGANLIDSQMANNVKSGYTFAVTPFVTSPPTFLLSGRPTNTSPITRTGSRTFCMLEDGVMRAAVSDTDPADRAACTAYLATGN